MHEARNSTINFHEQVSSTEANALQTCFFFGHRSNFFLNDQKKLSHFGQNVWKYMLMIIFTVSFNTTVRQMTEMSQWKKKNSSRLICGKLSQTTVIQKIVKKTSSLEKEPQS